MSGLASPVPIVGPDAEILRYLTQIVAIGRHKGAWDSADVVRVSEAHLPNPRTLRRALLNERVRADRLAADVAALREQVAAGRSGQPWNPPPVTGRKTVVVLRPHLARVLDEIVTGDSYEEIAGRLGITRASVTNAVSRVVQAFGVQTRVQVVVAVLTNRVAVQVDGERAA